MQDTGGDMSLTVGTLYYIAEDADGDASECVLPPAPNTEGERPTERMHARAQPTERMHARAQPTERVHARAHSPAHSRPSAALRCTEAMPRGPPMANRSLSVPRGLSAVSSSCSHHDGDDESWEEMYGCALLLLLLLFFC